MLLYIIIIIFLRVWEWEWTLTESHTHSQFNIEFKKSAHNIKICVFTVETQPISRS